MPYAQNHRLTKEEKKGVERIVQSNDFKHVVKLFEWKMDVIVDEILSEPDERKSFAMKVARTALSEMLKHCYDCIEQSDTPEISVGMKQESKRIFGKE